LAILRVAGITEESVADGPGLRFVVWMQGCPHRCDGCHNPQTWDYSGGYSLSTDAIIEQIKDNPLLSGLTFSGGEPFMQADKLIHIAREVKRLGLNVVTYTGYTLEWLMKFIWYPLSVHREVLHYRNLLNFTDYLIDGRFEQDKQSPDLNFRGSSNQRIIDVKASFPNGIPVSREDYAVVTADWS